MTSDSDRLLPVLNNGLDAWDGDRSAEHSTIEDRTDGAVRALPHLVELVLVHAFEVWSDCSALNCYTKLFGLLGGLNSDLVAGLVTLNEAKVVILSFEVHEWEDEFVFNHLPQDACHLVTVHLHDRSGHFDFFCHNSRKKNLFLKLCGTRQKVPHNQLFV